VVPISAQASHPVALMWSRTVSVGELGRGVNDSDFLSSFALDLHVTNPGGRLFRDWSCAGLTRASNDAGCPQAHADGALLPHRGFRYPHPAILLDDRPICDAFVLRKREEHARFSRDQ